MTKESPAMSEALTMLINGLAVSAHGGATFERRNPLDGSVATRAPAASASDAVAAVEAAAAAFKGWGNSGPGERRALLNKAADALEAKTPAFIAAMAAETGASAMWAGFNVHLAAGMLREAASLTTQISGEVIPSDVPGSLAMGLRQPAGVVLGIAPWNAPVILGVRAIATPLACGNTVVLKGSENCPRTHQLIIEALQEAGLPPGVVNYITNAPADAGAIVEAMVAHPAVRRVNFTGSTRVGKLIAQTCAKHLKQCVLELGGKAPLLVLADADLDAAVAAAAFGAFANSGQICMSTERIIVDKSVADGFAVRFTKKAKSLPLGDPRGPQPVVLGSVVGMGTVEHCNALLDDALAKGAKLLCGGRADSTLMPATVLDQVHRPRGRRRGRHRLRQRQRVRPLGRGVQPRHCTCDERGQTHRIRHLPHQRADRARRGADAVWGSEGQRLRPLWWPGGRGCLHRAALGDGADDGAPLPLLMGERTGAGACRGAGPFSFGAGGLRSRRAGSAKLAA
jgi:acyl-CoA reductase-like NAD-dependent aldehyde dehydrogenase